MEVEARVRKVIADVFNVPENQVDENCSSETLDAWDSLGHLQVIMAIEKEFDVRFKTTDLPALMSVPQLVKQITSTKAGK